MIFQRGNIVDRCFFLRKHPTDNPLQTTLDHGRSDSSSSRNDWSYISDFMTVWNVPRYNFRIDVKDVFAHLDRRLEKFRAGLVSRCRQLRSDSAYRVCQPTGRKALIWIIPGRHGGRASWLSGKLWMF